VHEQCYVERITGKKDTALQLPRLKNTWLAATNNTRCRVTTDDVREHQNALDVFQKNCCAYRHPA
jgi:hypothetical protein